MKYGYDKVDMRPHTRYATGSNLDRTSRLVELSPENLIDPSATPERGKHLGKLRLLLGAAAVAADHLHLHLAHQLPPRRHRLLARPHPLLHPTLKPLENLLRFGSPLIFPLLWIPRILCRLQLQWNESKWLQICFKKFFNTCWERFQVLRRRIFTLSSLLALSASTRLNSGFVSSLSFEVTWICLLSKGSDQDGHHHCRHTDHYELDIFDDHHPTISIMFTSASFCFCSVASLCFAIAFSSSLLLSSTLIPLLNSDANSSVQKFW